MKNRVLTLIRNNPGASDMLKALIDAERVRLIKDMITCGFVDFD